MRILLLSAYDAVSHKQWHTTLMNYFSQYDWTVLTLPARYFNWRVRGNSLTWAYTERETLTQTYDLVLATSMVDLSALRGLVPALCAVPSIVYFHENQFAYPKTSDQHQSVEPQLLSIYSALSANQIVFNSRYNRDTFFEGAGALLKKLPDCVPPGLLAQLEAKSQVVAVPLASERFISSTARDTPVFSIVWNHRWEYDKGPEGLLGCIQQLPVDLSLRIHVIGQQFRRSPKVFGAIKNLLSERSWLGEWGYVEDFSRYQKILAASHLVLSTALHDFQGLSILEAVAAGCIPVVPDRLAYRELFAADFRYESVPCAEQEAQAAANKIHSFYQRFHTEKTLPSADIAYLNVSNYADAYTALFEQALLARHAE